MKRLILSAATLLSVVAASAQGSQGVQNRQDIQGVLESECIQGIQEGQGVKEVVENHKLDKGEKRYYTHFAPMRIKSRESIDAILVDLNKIKASGVEHILGSHGAPATQEEVTFQIEYLERMKALLAKCSSSDLFAQQLIVSYPSLPGAEGVKAIAEVLYPDEVKSEEELAVRERIQDYFDMVSNLDTTIAKSLWAESGNISIITPRTQFFGYDSIMNDFLIKTFSSMRSRKLHSLSEVVNIYGSSANVQLYWIFDTVDAEGNSHQTRGRETLLFEKINDEWRLVHVHYSRMG